MIICRRRLLSQFHWGISSLLLTIASLTAQSGTLDNNADSYGSDLIALRDDATAGNCARAYRNLYAGGLAALPSLRQGLHSEDWQERLLCAVLFAGLQPQNDDFDLTCRILIGHLEDNEIRGDALLAGHALVLLGAETRSYLYAAAWHRDDQLGDKCRQFLVLLTKENWQRQCSIASAALRDLHLTLAWIGKSEPSAPALSVALPTVEERLRQSIVDLRDDQRRGNAVGAVRVLRYFQSKYSGTAGIDATAQSFLYEGLHYPDRQSRLLCAVLLMQRDAPPSAGLLAAAMESLKEDEFSGWATNRVMVRNAHDAMDYLLRHPQESRIFLFNTLRSSDQSQRLRAAAILARLHDSRTKAYVPVLMDHLQDNEKSLDATLASYSLAKLGPRALPWLNAMPTPDDQQAFYSELIHRAVRALEVSPTADIPLLFSGMNLGDTGHPRHRT